MFRAQECEQLGAGIVFFGDAVADVGPVKTGHEHPCLSEVQTQHDLAARQFIGGRRQRDARHIGKALMQRRELDVFRPEVVSPLRHAVRLVDGKQRYAPAALQGLQQRKEARRHEAFRRHIDEVIVAGEHCAFDVSGFLVTQTGIEEAGADARHLQRRDLILHERNQGGNDNAGALTQ